MCFFYIYFLSVRFENPTAPAELCMTPGFYCNGTLVGDDPSKQPPICTAACGRWCNGTSGQVQKCAGDPAQTYMDPQGNCHNSTNKSGYFVNWASASMPPPPKGAGKQASEARTHVPIVSRHLHREL